MIKMNDCIAQNSIEIIINYNLNDNESKQKEQKQNISHQLLYQVCEVQGQCKIQVVKMIQFVNWRFVIYVILCYVLIGIPFLLTFWYPILKKYFYYRQVTNIQECTHFFIQNYDSSITICQKKLIAFYETLQKSQQTYFFQNRYLNYLVKNNKVKVGTFQFYKRVQKIYNQKQPKGLNNNDVINLKNCYGPGVMIIKKPHILYLLATQVFRPLYLFIIFSCSLWVYQKYYYYAGIIFFTSALAIGITLYQVYTLNRKIYQMAYNKTQVFVLRNGSIQRTFSINLVPGDITFIKKQDKLPYDGVLLEGSALMNQSDLTGQSFHIVKKASPFGQFGMNKQTDKSAYVYQGTSIIHVNNKKTSKLFEKYRQQYGIPVCVIRTNFITMIGQQIRLISFPKQSQKKFQNQSTKFLLFLFTIAIITYIFLFVKLHEVVEAKDLVKNFLDIITITVPPGLSISMAVGILFTIEKLKKKRIFCISPNKVIIGGSVNYVCFDKTGTLTQNDMNFHSLVPSHNAKFIEPINQEIKKNKQLENKIKQVNVLSSIFANMAVNHSVTKQENQEKLVGNSMEINLLKFGDINFCENNPDPDILFSMKDIFGNKIHVLRRYQFDPDLQRMGVVALDENTKQFNCYSKGSPEMMIRIMNPKTVPQDYSIVLKKYAAMGLRVLAIASKKLQSSIQQIKKMDRQQMQDGIQFNGFEVFENKLKQQTKPAIHQLFQAEIPCVMITGDNPLTGSNISCKCGIADYQKPITIIDVGPDRKLIDYEFLFDYKANQQQKKNEYMVINPQKKEKMYQLGNNSQIAYQTSSMNQNQIRNISQIQAIQQSQIQLYLKGIIQKSLNSKASFCLTGPAFNKIFLNQMTKITTNKEIFFSKIRVFARAKPNDKAKIIKVYQALGKTIAMCGDGANDCGALKQADIGLSFSQQEASISSPFTSQIKNISQMIELIKQCRGGLATNFSLFNIMALYSLIQFTTSAITQFFYAYSADFQYLYWDVACNFFFFLVVGYTGTVQKLCVQKPSASLFALSNLCSVFIMAVIQFIGQLTIIWGLAGAFSQPLNYFSIGGQQINKLHYINKKEFPQDTPQTNSLFLFTNFMYIYSMLAFNISSPWKKEFYTNIPLMIILIIVYTYSTLIVMIPATRLPIFETTKINYEPFQGFILGMANFYGIVMFVTQKLILEDLFRWLKKKLPNKTWI